MIEKTEEMNALLDAYAALLTDKQKEVLMLYFQEDFSLSEIAVHMGTSRSAISDHIKRATSSLQEYEKKLKLVAKYKIRTQIYDKIKVLKNSQVNALVEQLEEIE
ncbi:MAG: sigma-70 family RNA polymerase sigma factor [Erysipelotrichaceae bacterium]|nr:sigma-70 family RNA polymerase sigma factor [Erysipelotrichaceae bacterium]